MQKRQRGRKTGIEREKYFQKYRKKQKNRQEDDIFILREVEEDTTRYRMSYINKIETKNTIFYSNSFRTQIFKRQIFVYFSLPFLWKFFGPNKK